MASEHCDRVLNCPCGPNPFANLSAEAADPASFFSFQFFDATIPLGAPSSSWGTTVGVAGCNSALSQTDADDCARRGATHTVLDTETDANGNPIPVYGNQAQSCSIPCPTGYQSYVYTVPAGTFIARSQPEADELAASYCFSRGLLNRVCVPTPTPPPTFNVTPLAWWKMEEAGDSTVPRIDVIGGLNLAVGVLGPGVINVAGAAGKIANGLQASSVSVDLCQWVPDTGDSTKIGYTAGAGMEFTFWMKVSNFTNALLVMDFYANAISGYYMELSVSLADATTNIKVDMYNAFANPRLNGPAVPIDGAWHFYRIYVDEAKSKLGLQVDNGVLTEIVFAGVPFDGNTGELAWNVRKRLNLVWNMNMMFDEMAIWPRKLTDAEASTLYNSGAGHTWPFTS